MRPPLGLLLTPIAGAAIGGGAILVSDRGVAERPVLAALILATAAAAGLAPLRYGLPVAVVLAFFEGFMIDFAGDAALKWNEVFIGLLVVRSLWQRRPSRWELIAAGALAAFFLAYLAAGTKPLAVFWGAKVLLTSAIALWAIARMRGLGRREGLAVFNGLATGVAASLVLAAWQRHEGIAGLLERGIPSDRVRTLGGALRAFAGFTTASPFAYALAIALLCWLALALSSRERYAALWTLWLPFAAILGLVWSRNRLAPLALGAALVIVGAREVLRRQRSARWTAVLAVGAVTLTVGTALHDWSTSSSATFRVRLWEEYTRELSAFGAGPGSAGSAYRHSDPRPWLAPLTYGGGWTEYATDEEGRVTQARAKRGTLLIGAGDAPQRPPLTLTGEVGSLLPGPLVFRLQNSVLARVPLPADRYRPIRVRLPPGAGLARLGLARMSSSFVVRALRIRGVPRARTPTLRVYQRAWEATPSVQANPAALKPGVVDNQYLSWLFQYGVFGVLVCAAWVCVLLVPLVRRAPPIPPAGAFVGCFLLAAASGVNVWEEAPTDLLAAAVLGLGFASFRQRRAT